MGTRRGRNQARSSDRRRQEVAFEAARILATEGQRNYLSAKEKAAHRLGVAVHGGLPSNSEVEAELKRYQALYGGEAHRSAVQQLRTAAIEAMKFFERFRPKLVGPVLEGTADHHSRITLHLFCETPDEVVQFLMRNRLPFEQETRRIRWHDASFRDLDLVVVEADGQVFELALMAGAAWRQPPPDPVDGRPQRRAGVGEVERLIGEPLADG
ncbi:hypothetical protein HFP89_09020 [Wenzhouxiangella sp. XN79A]|uniref:hypothetical protein n=1 Tax=Wenzhouxiangella sp. XN79A TaxID=2724193 RepID=UPI00144A9278|nr:hypothetical protein [Wenzhouxiangella sp. XN79A]NKI35307.1 hypothetical protein [Wenzhouxiangella sp. XN79A]